jgi:hypothetical protein
MFNRFLTSIGAASIFLLASCSTQQLARQDEQNDDVYYSKAKAVEAEEQVKREKAKSADYVTDQELYGDRNSSYDNSSDYEEGFYDGSYSARLYRFNNYTPWRSYYDSYYDYRFDPYYGNNYYSNNFYNGASFGIYIGVGRPYGYNYYNPWNYYGSQYYGSYWGPYSYYNVYNPYYGGNSYYGGNHGGIYNQPGYKSPNYRPRPVRGSENNSNIGRGDRINDTGPGAVKIDGQGRVLDTRSRAERYGDNPSNNNGVSTTDRSSKPVARPARTSENQPSPERATPNRNSGNNDSGRSQNTQEKRPARTERAAPERSSQENRPARTERSAPAPERSSTAPSNNNGNSSGGGDSSPRPKRGGGN